MGDILDDAQLAALQNYVRAGGGFVGVHSAAAAMLENSWYGQLIGAHFDFHPAPQWALVRVEDGAEGVRYIAGGESREDAPVLERTDSQKVVRRFDEWYNFKTDPTGCVDVLLTVEEASYSGGTHGASHPVAWCHEFQGARVFYTSLGHFDEAYQDPWFMGHIERAILWTAKVDT